MPRIGKPGVPLPGGCPRLPGLTQEGHRRQRPVAAARKPASCDRLPSLCEQRTQLVIDSMSLRRETGALAARQADLEYTHEYTFAPTNRERLDSQGSAAIHSLLHRNDLVTAVGGRCGILDAPMWA